MADTIKNMIENSGTITDARAMCFAYLMGCHETGNAEFAFQAASQIRAAFKAKFGKEC